MRSRRFAIAHDYCAALRRLAEKQLREIKWHADAAVAGGVAGEIPRVHADAGVGEPLHVGHRRIVVLFRIILLTLAENAEDAARCGVALRAGAYAGAANEDAVPIHVHGLLGNAHEDHERAARRKLGVPPILARLEYAGRFSGRRAFGMRRRLLHRLHGGEQGDGESEDF